MRRGLIILAVIAAMGIAAAAFVVWRINAGKSEFALLQIEDRKTLPSVRFRTAEGLVDLAEFSGRVVLLDVWASWCGPCLISIPHLNKLQKQYPEDLVVIGINVDEDGFEAVKRLTGSGVHLDYLVVRPEEDPLLLVNTLVDLDPIGKVSVLPTAFLVDRQGRLAGKYVGATAQRQIEKGIWRLVEEE